jgi:hypothetical protein
MGKEHFEEDIGAENLPLNPFENNSEKCLRENAALRPLY